MANLTDKPFVGQFKVAAASGSTSLPAARCKFSQGFAIADRVGRALYDPIMPLTLNSVLRLAPKESVPIYLEIDTHGLTAGVYRSTLSLKKAMPGFTDEPILLDVEVAGADLGEVSVDRAGYDYVGNTFAQGNGAKNVAKLLVSRGYNVVFVTASRIFPCERRDGSFAINDFGSLDRHLDAVLAGGLKRERMKLWVYTMTDPLPVSLESKAIDAALPRLAEVYDVIELYRPKVTAEKKRLVAVQNIKEVWTYSILTKENLPVVYRRDYWENMRDGYREIATFWHMTQAAGSPFDSNDFTTPGRYDDYASLYVDFANDAALLSRRQLAADMGFEDVRLVMWLRNRFKGDAASLAKVDAIVKEAADAGTMSAMDKARDRLLDLADLNSVLMRSK